MHDMNAFERQVARQVLLEAGPSRPVDVKAVVRSNTPQAITWRSQPLISVTRFVVVAVVVALFSGFLLVAQPFGRVALTVPGAETDGLPPVTGPAGNGLIAFSRDGDIFVGDPVAGTTTAIVTGPTIDSRPLFSPDGTRIAFLRGDPWTEEASVIVVAADGSDERVAMPAGYSRGTDVTWTPDGTSILANVDIAPFAPHFDGELALLDPSGLAEPRLITPPLPRGPGGPYFRYTDQVAPMFRPPDGDVILTTAVSASRPATPTPLYAWDGTLEQRTTLAPEGLERFEPYYFQPWALWWSPDGSRVAFELGWGDAEVDFGLFVMDADGRNVHGLVDVYGNPMAWSPDGTRMAVQRCLSRPDGRDGADIVIVDVASGSERILEATSVATKQEGQALPRSASAEDQPLCGWYQWADGRAWDYEGWSWSPDGRAIMLLERSGTRPLVVDVETGAATELPWESGSALSWQRVAAD